MFITLPLKCLECILPAIPVLNQVVESAEWKSFIKDNALEELYLQYPTVEATKEFYKNWESMVSWMLYDAGVTKFSPSDFGIEK